jgi:putative endonuclease
VAEADPSRHYTGLTQDLDARILSHNAGQVSHTAKYRPWRIETAVAFCSREKAVAFERYLKSQIKKCDYIKNYVNKFVAHAAAPETRADLQDEEKAITLGRLESCYKTIYQVASFISGLLLWESSLRGLPVPQFDHLKDIEKRWVSPKNVGKAREMWQAFEKKISKWDSI